METEFFYPFPANNQFYSTSIIESRPNIEEEIILVLNEFKNIARTKINVGSNDVPDNIFSFKSELVRHWLKHNSLCDEMDGLLASYDGSREGVESLARVYFEMNGIDSRKRALSVRIKPVIDLTYSKISHFMTDREKILATTCVRPDFPTAYVNDHSLKDRSFLVSRYHRGSDKFMDLRLKSDSMVRPFHRISRQDIYSEKIEMLAGNSSRRTLECIDFLLELDNFWEPLWVKSLVGLPEYLLREKLVGFLLEETGTSINPFDDCSIGIKLKEVGV